MKVILSIDPVHFPLTGIGRYTYELARGLNGAGLESLWFSRGGHLEAPNASLFASANPVPPKGASYFLRRVAGRLPLVRKIYRLHQQRAQSRSIQTRPDHVFHSPNYSLPEFDGPSVVTMHDLSIFLRSQDHPAARVASMTKEIELSLKRAQAIITDTEHTRQEIAEYFGWPLARIHAVHLASASEFHPRGQAQLEATLAPFDLRPQGYALFTGTIEPRKNLSILLDAYGALPHSLRQRWPLVVCGYGGWLSEDLHARMKRAEKEGWLRYLGYLSQDLLPSFMAGARLFSLPSHYEGFGLPLVEAMASGVPVISSSASCLPEVGGDAPAYHEPGDVDALRGHLERGLDDAAWRERARALGLKQSARYSWPRCTQETLAVYRTVARAP